MATNNNEASHLYPDTVSEQSYDSRQPLLPPVGDKVPALYNPESTLQISTSVAEGFLILLTGSMDTSISAAIGKSNAIPLDSNVEHDDSISLAFAALTDGNVIDTCMGINAHGGVRYSGSTQTAKTTNNLKDILRDAGDLRQGSGIQNTAVHTYARCFRIVIAYNERLKKDLISYFCCKTEKIRKEAVKELEACFSTLNELLNSFV